MKTIVTSLIVFLSPALHAAETYCMGLNLEINVTAKQIRYPEKSIQQPVPARVNVTKSGRSAAAIYTIRHKNIFITSEPNQGRGWGGENNTHITEFDSAGNARTVSALCNIAD